MSKILLISPNYGSRYNSVNEDMRNEIRRRYDVIRYGQRYENMGRGYHVDMLLSHFGTPDLIIVWHPKHLPKLDGLRDLKIPKICMVTDYPPEWEAKKNEFIFKHEFHLVFFTQTFHVNRAKFWRTNYMIHKDTRFQHLPFAIDTTRYDRTVQKDIDIFAVMSANDVAYPNRRRVIERLNSIDRMKTYAHLVTHKRQKLTGEKWADTVCRSKMAVASNGRFMSVNFKHLEYSAAGCLMFTDKARDLGKLGFVAKKHFIPYDGMKHLRRELIYYRDHQGERNSIAERARKLVQEQHDVRIRVPQMFELIEKRLGIKINEKGVTIEDNEEVVVDSEVALETA